MEVNVIFAYSVEIDERNNFKVNFQDENKIIEVLLNRKKDYYLTNAIAFIENKKTYAQPIKNLENIAKRQLLAEENSSFDTMIDTKWLFIRQKKHTLLGLCS